MIEMPIWITIILAAISLVLCVVACSVSWKMIEKMDDNGNDKNCHLDGKNA